MHASPPLGKRTWTAEEENYLRESWGTVTVDGICRHLNRTKNAIMVRVHRLGLPPYLESGEYITLHQLSRVLGFGASSDKYFLKSWVENRGFPLHYKRRGTATIRVVYLEEFWPWAEKNRSFLDFSKMEPLALGAEPEWVAEQRRKDFQAFAIQRKDPWTPEEDGRLKTLVEQQRYGYELRADFVATVSAAAIKKRLADVVALWAYAEYRDDTSWLTEEEIIQATGVGPFAEDDEDGEDDAAFTLQAVTDAIGKTPEKALLRMIYARLGDGKSEGYFRSYWNSYTMKHEENEKLDRIYALLVKLGYEMSDDEKALQDGTHELFGEVTDE